MSSNGYDFDISCTHEGWTAAFALALAAAVDSIANCGPFGPVEVTLTDGSVVVGVLDFGRGADQFKIDNRVIETDDVARLRA